MAPRLEMVPFRFTVTPSREKGMELRQSPEATRGPSISPLMRPTRSSSPAALRE